MPPQLNRRDFLKLAATLSLAPLAGVLSADTLPKPLTQGQALPNVIFIVFDAMSALNLSLHGYPRKTSTNLERLAERATVYHFHHAAGNFTAPSTASLFTSTYPWTHRVFTLNGLVNPNVRPRNTLNLLGGVYYEAAFVQNMYADLLLYQFREQIDRHLKPESFSLLGNTIFTQLFPRDPVYGAKSYDQFLFDPKEKPGSFLFSVPLDLWRRTSARIMAGRFEKAYPEGLPYLDSANIMYTIDQVMQGIQQLLPSLPAPFFAYLHLMPPHAPYRQSKEFLGMFTDGWTPIAKKKHRLGARLSQEKLNKQRQDYDEYIANLDAEFGKLLDYLEESGLLENSYLFVTSDHGDLFERGEQGHVTPLLYEPVIHSPLLISAPGQRQRQDVYSLTSNVDILPTLLKIAGQEIPPGCEGQLLPGLGGEESAERSVFTIEAKRNPSHQPLNKASIALIRGHYKLIYYTGYREFQGYEFYDLENDPEEMNNVYASHPAASELQNEMDERLKQADQPFTQ